MKTIVFLLLPMLLSNCTSAKEDNIEIVHRSLDKELNDFLLDLLRDTFQLKKVVTVHIVPEGKHYQVSFKNKIPSSCNDVIGSARRGDQFIIYFVAKEEYPSLIRRVRTYNCELEQKRNPLNIPLAIDVRERFYRFERDSLSLIGPND